MLVSAIALGIGLILVEVSILCTGTVEDWR